MPCTRLRELLDAGRTALGCWTSLADAAVVEMIAHAGFDYVSIDMEHSPLDLGAVMNLLRAATGCGISALVRPPAGDEGLVARVADMAPDGLYFPHVRHAADARRAVQQVRYAPLGQRGVSLHSRAARYGDVEDPVLHRRRVDAHLLVWVQIEEAGAVADIEQIVATEGIDICGLAPHDLARSLGCKPSPQDARFMEQVGRVATVVGRSDRVHLAVPATAFGLEGALALGARLVNVTDAAAVLTAGLRDRLSVARKALDAAR
jgi:2-keto-3-deoxy-L-rhamnonate aldolase RhmA